MCVSESVCSSVIDLTVTRPVYIETSWAWYRLDSPSEQYEPVHTHFMFPESVAQIVLSNAKHHRNESLKDFLDRFKNMRYMHYKPFEEQDLWNSVSRYFRRCEFMLKDA